MSERLVPLTYPEQHTALHISSITIGLSLIFDRHLAIVKLFTFTFPFLLFLFFRGKYQNNVALIKMRGVLFNTGSFIGWRVIL